MSPQKLILAVGIVIVGFSPAALRANPIEFGKDERLSSGKVTFGNPGPEYQIGQYELTLRPTPVSPSRAEATGLGAQSWMPAENAWSVPAGGGSTTDWHTPLPGASASGGGLSLDLLRISHPAENSKPAAVKLTGEPAFFSGAAQFTGISDQDSNTGWLRESVPAPVGGMASGLLAIPFVLGLLLWLLLGYEKVGHRRHRSSSRGIPARPLSPRRRR